MRLIDTENAWRIAQRIYSDPVLLHAIKNVLDSTDTVNAVEAVRCKDCKHYEWNLFDGCHVCIRLSKYVKEDFFCSYGEKRNEHET